MSEKKKEKAAPQGFVAEFKEFINRGNVVDLAVGVAVGGAFTTIVNSLVDDMVMPVVSLIGGGANVQDLALDIPNFFGGETVAHIAYGSFLQNVIQFLIIAFVVFLVVKAMNRVARKGEQAKKQLAKKKSK